MIMPYPVQTRWIGRWVGQIPLLIIIVAVVSACGGNAQIRQEAMKNLNQLHNQILHGQQIGIPLVNLHPILIQEQQLASGSAPNSFFSDQPIDTYYTHVSQQALMLQGQLQKVIITSSQQVKTQARQDIASAQAGIKRWSQYTTLFDSLIPTHPTLPVMFDEASKPGDYTAISSIVAPLLTILLQLQSTKQSLNNLNTIINLMQQGNLDTTAIQSLYRTDMSTFDTVKTPGELNTLDENINTHQITAMTMLTQALPTLTANKLAALQQTINQMGDYQINPGTYQERYNADKQLIHPLMSMDSYQTFAQQTDTDINNAQKIVLQTEGKRLLAQYMHEATTWGNRHAYYDNYNGYNYQLDAGYLNQGIASILSSDLNSANSVSLLQSAIQEIQTSYFNLKMMEIDATDATPYNQVHQADREILNHYQLQNREVIVVSMAQQAMRIYQNGHLIRSMLVTTGRYTLPSLPGVWSVEDKESPTEFRSSDPPGSPYWYPPTHINYAILFHSGGYFIHDAWWRDNFGPGTEFPHHDPANDPQYANDGSHGCVNLSTYQAGWLYNNTNWNTAIVIY